MPKSRKRKRAAAQPITKSSPISDPSCRGPALIRKFHVLQTAAKAAELSSDTEQLTSIQCEIEQLGGIDRYQKASIRGQDKRRGGDSSKTLVEWLKSPDLAPKCCPAGSKSRVLEIGSLSTDNYISRHPNLTVTRIDLNSQDAAIQQQDFLKRPLPKSHDDKFDGISCSLVLNFVPTAQRSEFLIHLTNFLPVSEPARSRWLFFVMPAPCINNSRYMDKALLMRIFGTLGFECVKSKVTDRIAYWLFIRVKEIETEQQYKKVELQGGKERNNFFIPLKT